MTDDERRLLEMAKPDLVVQAAPVFPMEGFTAKQGDNPHFDAAEALVAKGWLVHVEDMPIKQSKYRLTPEGAAALQAKD